MIIVSGLPRSGTSLMCQLLQSAGLKVADDGKRKADGHNPYGYFEVEGIIGKLKDNPGYLDTLNANAVKVVAHGLYHVPEKSDVIYMIRAVDEIKESMSRMVAKSLNGLDKLNGSILAYAYRNFNVLTVSFDQLVKRKDVKSIEGFIGKVIDSKVIHTRN